LNISVATLYGALGEDINRHNYAAVSALGTRLTNLLVRHPLTQH
jgi:hypothetical protein